MQLHIPVLLNPTLEFAKSADAGYYLDATLGYAGHASAILRECPQLKLLGFDQDPFALEQSSQKLSEFKGRFQIFQSNFRHAFSTLKSSQIPINQLRFVLADIGVSSVQLDYAERGFGFDAPTLDMRMNPAAKLDAATVVNSYSASQLSDIFIKYAQLPAKLSADLATKIILARPISSCQELSSLIGNAKLNGRNVSLKTLVFQAIRIEVNDELAALESFLEDAKELKNCTLAIISFHSLEDAIIKQAFKNFASDCICPSYAERCTCGKNHSLGKILTKKPITPDSCELEQNSRSSCAKLRAFCFKAD